MATASVKMSEKPMTEMAIVIDDAMESQWLTEVIDCIAQADGWSLLRVGQVSQGQATPVGPQLLRSFDRWMRGIRAPALPSQDADLCLISGDDDYFSAFPPPESDPSGRSSPHVVLMLCDAPEIVERAHLFGCGVWYFSTPEWGWGSGFDGYAAMMESEPVSRIDLMSQHRDEAQPVCLGSAESRTHSTSPELNKVGLRKSALRLLAEALETGAGDGRPTPELRLDGHQRLVQSPPGLAGAVRVAARSLVAAARSRIRRQSGQVEWVTGTVQMESGEALSWDSVDWINVPRDRFVADPFPVRWQGRDYLFVEEFVYERGKGTIGVMEANGSGPLSDLQPVMEQPFHLSFPNVFEHQGELFMLPEQADSGQLVLYRCHQFPADWRPHAVLLKPCQAADPVLFAQDGLWWLFFSRSDFGSHDNNLQLYYSGTLEGPYVRHPQSPVRETLNGSRMAGWIMRECGEIIRPGQDCTRFYGGGVVYNRICQLDPDCYREELIWTLTPDPQTGFLGAHTYNRLGEMVAIDAFRYLKRRQR